MPEHYEPVLVEEKRLAFVELVEEEIVDNGQSEVEKESEDEKKSDDSPEESEGNQITLF